MSDSEQSFLIALLRLVRRWQRFILINVSIITLAALVISLLLTKTYRAEARILGGRSGLGELGLASLIQDLPFEGLGLIPQADKTLQYLAILSSRTVMMNIVEKFDLQKRYETPNWEKTLKRLADNVSFEVNPDETISVFVIDESPHVAAEMANAFVRQLDSVNIQLRVQKARDNREFLEARLTQCKADLASAEQRLKEFQETYGVIEVTEQARAAIQTISELQAQVLIKETELRVKRHYLSEFHTEIAKLETQLEELKKSLRSLQIGQGGAQNGTPDLMIPTSDVPELAMRYFRLLREVEIQNLLYKALIQQYEQASIVEAKETPTVQVLDWAVAPIHKYAPKRAFIVLGAFFFSLFVSLVFAAGTEKWHRVKDELNREG